MRLDQILQLEPVARTTPRIHAGHRHLSNSVNWVHISEMERVELIFHGGELLLTQGRGIPRTPEGQCNWVEALATAGVSGVAIESGHAFDEIPPEVIAAAVRCELPLIELPRPAYFMEITRAVHSQILHSEQDSRVHSAEFGRRLSQLVLDGGSLQEVLDAVASTVGHPVALTGPAHSLRAKSPQQHPVLQEVEDWRSHTQPSHELRATRTIGVHASESRGCQYVVLHVGGQFWACLHMITGGTEPEASAVHALELAATTLALAFGPRESAQIQTNDIWSEILRDVLSASGSDTDARLRWGGLDPGGTFRVLMLEPAESKAAGIRAVTGHRRTEALLSLSFHAQQALPQNAIIGHFNNRIAVVVAQSVSLDTIAPFKWSGSGSTMVGASGLVDAHSLVRAAEDATEALDYAIETGGKGSIFYADQLYLERLLLRLDEDGTLTDLVEHELGPIFDQTHAARNGLLDTLEAFFATNGVKNNIAHVLGIDRRTAHNRIARINELVGRDFEHPDKQLLLRLAMRGHRLLQYRALGNVST